MLTFCPRQRISWPTNAILLINSDLNLSHSFFSSSQPPSSSVVPPRPPFPLFFSYSLSFSSSFKQSCYFTSLSLSPYSSSSSVALFCRSLALSSFRFSLSRSVCLFLCSLSLSFSLSLTHVFFFFSLDWSTKTEHQGRKSFICGVV